MKKIRQNFLKTLSITFLIFLYSCATNNIDSSGGNLKYDKACDVETRILKSYGDTVRIEYEPTKSNSADNMASEYCLINRNKISTKNQVSCDGCCRATYLCKKEQY
ncbi:MAG: hypothetical protein CL572_05310 [Alphaproteobacteria bacterium]|jgi:hypothetical protein|nr:hypothetical protein [Alphaproteobacteria bacterium]|tara:strand:+ start:93 stop:410 length:318 start_codon:yes stop_codon:yes gene_type:complete